MRVPLQVLKFVSGESAKLPLRFSINTAEPGFLNKLKEQRKFGVYLLPQASAKELTRLDKLVYDRGVKPERKSLAQLLLKQKRVPLLSCGYSSTGRLQQGVGAFLKQAAAARDRNLYLIAVPDALFMELWSEADGVSQDGKAKRSKSRSKNAPSAGVANYDLVLNLLPPVAIPREFEQTYVGQTLEAHLVRVLVMRAAASQDPVLILGDTGTGKEVTARAIHQYSKRSNDKFVPVNCGSIPRELLEAELFGIKGGVATNVADRRGLWEQTGRGTLFLDEIGELSSEHQVKVLRALEENAVRRVGEVDERKVHARIVAATNRQLFSMVLQGTFRADLYYRLRVLTIPTPSLRDIPEDLSLLAQFLWKRVTDDESCVLSEEVLDELRTYTWPGNVRELKSILKNIHALFGADKIKRQHVRAVFELLGIQHTARTQQDAANQVLQHRMECLRHLRRVDEVVRASQVAIESLIATATERKGDHQQPVLRNLLSELDLLLRRPLLFHDEVLFALTSRLRDSILHLQILLGKGGREARAFWSAGVFSEFQLVLKLVFQEVSELLAV
ncbi:MAG TPA: sigma 54-interacting transcriptional regulator [Pyrinomonadaceae bacterium]|nr:sigma 54-interacting transcriptional regulator [Pyrinomonadaceae bacterium]